MAKDKKYKNKITEDSLNEWLSSTGFLFPVNEFQLARFNKLYEDYEFKLSDAMIDYKAIINGSLCKKAKVLSKSVDLNLRFEIESLRMVARKGSGLPQDVIDKIRRNHDKDRDNKE